MALTETAALPAAPAARRAKLNVFSSVGLGAAGLLAFLLIWQAVPSLGLVNPMMLPGPLAIPAAFQSELASGMWFTAVTGSLSHYALGLVLGSLLGVALGVLTGMSRVAEDLTAWVVRVLRPIPGLAWAPFAIIWFGISDATTVFVVFMTAMPLILTSVWQGAQAVEPQYVDLARSFRLSRWQILRKIHAPSILPHFFSGARLAFGFGWRVSLVAETIGASDGIGYRLRQAADLVQTDQVFAWTVLLVGLMLLIEGGVLKPAERRLFRWKSASLAPPSSHAGRRAAAVSQPTES